MYAGTENNSKKKNIFRLTEKLKKKKRKGFLLVSIIENRKLFSEFKLLILKLTNSTNTSPGPYLDFTGLP
jgi:hypothetical protein